MTPNPEADAKIAARARALLKQDATILAGEDLAYRWMLLRDGLRDVVAEVDR